MVRIPNPPKGRSFTSEEFRRDADETRTFVNDIFHHYRVTSGADAQLGHVSVVEGELFDHQDGVLPIDQSLLEDMRRDLGGNNYQKGLTELGLYIGALSDAVLDWAGTHDEIERKLGLQAEGGETGHAFDEGVSATMARICQRAASGLLAVEYLSLPGNPYGTDSRPQYDWAVHIEIGIKNYARNHHIDCGDISPAQVGRWINAARAGVPIAQNDEFNKLVEETHERTLLQERKLLERGKGRLLRSGSIVRDCVMGFAGMNLAYGIILSCQDASLFVADPAKVTEWSQFIDRGMWTIQPR